MNQVIQDKIKSINQIAVSVKEGIRIVNINDIIQCQADSNYCKIVLKSGEIIYCSKTLKAVESKLPKDNFIRTHNSHLVNMDFVEFLYTNQIKLIDQIILPLSKSKKKAVLEYFMNQIV